MFEITYKTHNSFECKVFAETEGRAKELVDALKKLRHVTCVEVIEKSKEAGQ